MAVVGIDFGALASKIGVARHRGIDIITNEVSNRATPSLVAFGPKQRQIGESAKTQETSNFKNTVGSLKRLVGRQVNDPDVQDVEVKKFLYTKVVEVDGGAGVQVNFRGEPTTFSSTQLVGMYLGKLRDIASNELKTGVTDVVIAVPGWFTDIQRRAVLDAAAIANLNVLRLINDTTASALGYGITKSDLPEESSPRHVVFVDVGHSDMSVSVVAFWKGNLKVLSSAYDRHLGGRDIDYALVNHFSHEFKSKYKIDVLSNPKATFRLLAGCEKLKKVLSANAEAPMNVESIMNDVDASSKLTRDQLEALLEPLLARIPIPIQAALHQSGLSPSQIDSIELVGGSTRIPAVRSQILSVFPNKQLSFTLNQDEAIARGATFTCAMLSPTFRVRDFHMVDVTPYSIIVSWLPQPGDGEDGEDTELVVFPAGNNIPSTKVLTFYRTENRPFSVDISYQPSPPSTTPLPGGITLPIAKFTVENVIRPSSTREGDLVCVRVKVRLNQHGVVSVESAYVEEVEEKEDVIPQVVVPPLASNQAMDVDGAAPPAPAAGAAADGTATPGEPAAPVVTKKKKIIKKKELLFSFTPTSTPLPLTPTVLSSHRETELSIHTSDKLVMDTEDRKNALEEYVYDMRGKLDERYAPYVKPAEKETLFVKLNEAEEWLYTEEGEDALKSAYVERLDSLKKLGDPITTRYKESVVLLKPAVAQLRETLDLYESQAGAQVGSGLYEKFEHIGEGEKQKVVEKCAATRQWLDDLYARQSERRKDEDPVLKSEEVSKKRDEVIYFVTPILSKPKPKATPNPSTTGTPSAGTPKPEEGKERKGATPEPGSQPQGPSEMDID